MERQYYSFVVKIHDGDEPLRGYIERVSNRKRAYFKSLPEMNKFINDQVAEPVGEKEPGRSQHDGRGKGV